MTNQPRPFSKAALRIVLLALLVLLPFGIYVALQGSDQTLALVLGGMVVLCMAVLVRLG
jgi:hypothetical protein